MTAVYDDVYGELKAAVTAVYGDVYGELKAMMTACGES